MKHKPKIFFNPIEGSAPLSINWYPGPYGDAHEAKEGNGVYFASPNGELLAVQFDDVEAKQDQQVLTTKIGVRVSVTVKAGKTSIRVTRTSKKVA
ncbi:MAG: hypothetical protein NTV34_11255 [Proteobacteria bacterium]|nr:hypothetical protein [Pseudomonadota bacterium]